MYSAAAMPGTPHGMAARSMLRPPRLRSGAVGAARQRPAVQAQHGVELLGLLDVAGDALGDPEVPAEVGAVRVGWPAASAPTMLLALTAM